VPPEDETKMKKRNPVPREAAVLRVLSVKMAPSSHGWVYEGQNGCRVLNLCRTFDEPEGFV
jgi:hypothetical protein